MTYLAVCRTFPPMVGGIERYVSELLLRSEVPGLVVAPRFEGDAAHDETYGVRVRRYHYHPSWAYGKRPLLPMTWSAMAAAIRHRPDVIIGDQVQSAAVSIPLARACRRPHVLFAYGLELSPTRMPRTKRMAFHHSTAVVAISRFTHDALRRIYDVPSERIEIIHPGVDTSVFQPARESRGRAPRLLTVGRLSSENPYKGYDRVIRCLHALHAEFPDLMLDIAGDGDDRPRLEALARDLGLANHVRFLGYVPDEALPSVYQNADVFVLPSGDAEDQSFRLEGYGIVFAEASASGIPSVAYALGGVVDPVKDGITGYLTPPDERQLNAAVRALIVDRDLRARMGAKAREHAEQTLSWHNSTRKFRDLLGSLTSRKAAAQ